MSPKARGSSLRELPILIISALVLSIIVKTFFIQFFYIPSGSMENTLQVNDRVGVNKFGALFSDIKRGEVVVFRDPANWLSPNYDDSSGIRKVIKDSLVFVGVLPDPSKQYLIKRVIGVGGDKVRCCGKDGKVEVNGVSINEPYIYEGDKPSDSEFEVEVPQGFIWVMGDHRGASADSRFHTDDPNKGMVALDKVTGRATFIIWPFSNLAILEKGEDLSKIPVKSSK
ncbi:MAG: signal peptidase I [Actinobacteria bacterium BACL2 MAG-121001-bin67]|jgi:signal peptidase I|uniref:Signal peptidase I n=4 Tax=ac1 cluster TaxID=1655545 RepID=A0A0R2PBH4_9ACTN|nr:MAG: signal peptidase I [Actinobacteria bacterium BACL2 MAG-120802-bin41]KRO32341.1 MAG: signal peptidase I [Actinobacteria bacterium BACL2 MAG-121220-bin52]KRO32634.1 MAG: signal peptidase I [Actinobacteria bacterium BACL2 MAG-121001-bin67]KRO74202.1 MAG: signal peptidase I [Actinobacteria bacterium BACL2 MAG-120920-bin34]MDP4614832.1 signal peptidase I [Candidatus Nanopelagicales bacterium]MDP4864490.1 signal peptidase I [Candidatus Nanopelagicaceae bacterium]